MVLSKNNYVFIPSLFAMKNAVLVIVAVVAAAGGYYVGYDVGFEKGENHEHADTMEQEIPEHGDDARLGAASTMLIGKWSSEDDRNFIREYKDDGTVIDSYGSVDGDVNTEATWELFTSNMNENVPFQLNNRDVYIMQTEKGGEKLYFRIISVTPDSLELMNMESAGAMRFGKMNGGNEMQDGIED
jgi:hypothetical protein